MDWLRCLKDRGIGAGEEPDKIESPSQSRACLLGDQVDLWVGQSPLPQAREEYSLVFRQLRLGEFVCGAAATLGGDIGDRCPKVGCGPSDGR